MKRFFKVSFLLVVVPVAVFGYTRTGTGPYTFTLTSSAGSTNGVPDSVQDMQEVCSGGGPTGPAAAGDTIVIPNGTFNWGLSGWGAQPAAGVTITSQNGPANTTINVSGHGTINYGVILLQSNCVVSGINFVTSTTEVDSVLTISASPCRITNCTFTDSGNSGSYFLYDFKQYGVVDNCTITSGTTTGEWMFIVGPDNVWQMTDTQCRAVAVYIEHCTFNGTGYVMDNNSSGCCVVRFNTITGATKVDSHGYASDENGSPPRGCRLTDVYCNTWTFNFGGNPTVEIRGGTGVFFDNSSVTSANMYFEDYGYQGHWPNFSSIEQTPQNYPIKDQIGVGEDIGGEFSGGAGSDPFYAWGNIQNGSPWLREFKSPDATPSTGANTVIGAIPLYKQQINNSSYYFTEDEIIREDRDIFTDLTVSYTLNNATNYNGNPTWTAKSGSPTFNGTTGVGVGSYSVIDTGGALSAANMIAAGNTKAVGFWATDQGSWNNSGSGGQGELYAWNGSAWVLKYSPHPYPYYSSGPIAPSNLSISSP